MKKTGVTLIEILIVVGVTMLIMVSISGIMSGVFTSQNKNKASDQITQNGSWILNELKKNVLNADSNSFNGGKFTCPIDSFGNSIVITNVKDGDKTTIKCLGDAINGYEIASISGKAIGTTIFLFQKNSNFFLKDCNNFVNCSTLPTSNLSTVRFNFELESGIVGLSSGTTKAFLIDVTLRN